MNCDNLGWRYPVALNGDRSRRWIARCDNCERFGSDLAAARALGTVLQVRRDRNPSTGETCFYA